MRGLERIAAFLVAAAIVLGCAPPEAADSRALVRELAESYWERQLADSPYLQVKHGVRVTGFPDATLEEVREDVAFARSLLARVEAVPTDGLPHEDVLTLQLLEWQARQTIDAEPYYWHTFEITPYIAGFGLTFLQRLFADHPLGTSGDTATYLELMADYAKILQQGADKVEAQAERGIYLYRDALPGAIGLFTAFRDGAPAAFTVADGRLAALEPEAAEAFREAVADRLAEELLPAFERLLGVLGSAEYAAVAPENVGVAQYGGGKEYYRFLVRLHTTLETTPEALHELGQAKVAELSARMAAIRDELGFAGTQEEFHEQLRTDPRFLAQTPQEVEDRFQQYVARIEPRIGEQFRRLPKARYGVQRLDPAAEAGMTFGYYQQPTPQEPRGLYRYNGSNLSERSLIFSGPLIYHELVPGHHFHLASQNENESLPMFRRELSPGAFNEGWGNYASQLASEMGLLDDPYDQYAWAVFDMFISVRLVVDTGMNYLGWTLEEGREFMRRHTFQSETEIASESLRYSTDMPGQALAYKAGLEKLLELRAAAREIAGDDFDVRDFHEAVLGNGGMPYPVLEKHVRWYFSERPRGLEGSR